MVPNLLSQAHMALREFTDAHGNRWTVWTTIPEWRGGVPSELQDGWLTFECGQMRKRLAPIPRDWEEASIPRMWLYCSAAQTLPPSRQSGPRDAEREDR
ncbi:MAG TPA: hypothetical protein VFO55_06285 [Gemmatimonadaceae bacterium]|nr:hypothetical protein [Gemmatimonadaceae bacterium]